MVTVGAWVMVTLVLAVLLHPVLEMVPVTVTL
jgi:hypothetical protein